MWVLGFATHPLDWTSLEDDFWERRGGRRCSLMAGVTHELGKWLPTTQMLGGRRQEAGSPIKLPPDIYMAEEHHIMASQHGLEMAYHLCPG